MLHLPTAALAVHSFQVSQSTNLGQVAGLPQDEFYRTPSVSISTFALNSYSILLPTASVLEYGSDGIAYSAKALLDTGSISTFVSTKFFNNLNLPSRATNVKVKGITNSPENINFRCEMMIHASTTDFAFKAGCLVILKIASALPSLPVVSDNWNIPRNLVLADPNFGTPSDIDLIGANYFWKLLLPEQHLLGKDKPILQTTRLGYIVLGPIPFIESRVPSFHCVTTENYVDDSLVKFWEVEEIPLSKPFSTEQIKCENHFIKDVTRGSSGRYVVRIQFNIIIIGVV